MKILFLTSAFYPSIGGVETHVLKISRELVYRGHKVTIITESKHSEMQSDNEAKDLKSIEESSSFVHKKIFFSNKKLHQIDIYYFKFGQASFFKKFKIWYLLFKNINLFQSVDVIHIHDVFIWYLPIRFILLNKKVFTTFHGYETVFPPEKKAIWIRKISEKLSYGNICIGDFIKKWYTTKPDYVLYGGVEDKQLDIVSKTKNKKMKMLLAGRLEKDMGIQIYKEAFKKLKDRGVGYELTVCGGGAFQEDLEVYGKVLGFVPKIEEYLKKADIVFASSYLIILQALSFGKPVFSSYTNPLKHDYLCDSPFKKFIFVSHGSEELVKQIVRYKPNRRKLHSAARWAQAQTWEKVTDTYIELWNKK